MNDNDKRQDNIRREVLSALCETAPEGIDNDRLRELAQMATDAVAGVPAKDRLTDESWLNAALADCVERLRHEAAEHLAEADALSADADHRADLDRCDNPDCSHDDHREICILSQCHPDAGFTATYDCVTGVLHLNCSECDEPVSRIAVAP